MLNRTGPFLIFLCFLVLAVLYFSSCAGERIGEVYDEPKIAEAEHETEEPALKERVLLSKITALRELYNNEDIVGFVEIKGTSISDPVVQSSDNAYYLNHNLHGEFDRQGAVFLDFENDLDELQDDNTIIYGHNLKNGAMFHDIRLYFDEDFYKEHKHILLTTPYEETLWEIFSFFQTTTDFYYLTTNYQDKDEFFDFILQLQKMSLYETGVNIDGSDQILILSTCAVNNESGNNRYVLAAKREKP